MTATCRHWEIVESPREGQGDKVRAVCKYCKRTRLLFASWQPVPFYRPKRGKPA
jgi:hypothetical protein